MWNIWQQADAYLFITTWNKSNIEFVVFTVIIYILSIIGIVGNGIVLRVYVTIREWTVSNILVMCLAITDLSTCLVLAPAMPFALAHPFPNATLIKLFYAGTKFVVFVSIFILLITSEKIYEKIFPTNTNMSSVSLAVSQKLFALRPKRAWESCWTSPNLALKGLKCLC